MFSLHSRKGSKKEDGSDEEEMKVKQDDDCDDADGDTDDEGRRTGKDDGEELVRKLRYTIETFASSSTVCLW